MRRERGGVGLGRVAAEGEKAVLEARVPGHRGVGDRGIRARHLLGRGAQLLHDAPESARVEDARARRVLGVARPRILGQIADLARALDAAGGGQRLPRERPREGRLARAVAPDEADLVAPVDAEVHVLHEQARSHADLQVMHGEHSEDPFLREGGDKGANAPAR